MKIAVDVMGGDFAPQELVSGAKSYLQAGGEAGLILVGDEKKIHELWRKQKSFLLIMAIC